MTSGLVVVVVYDADTRRASSVDLGDARDHLPEDLHLLLDPTELVPLGLRPDKAEEMTKQIMWRAGIATTGAVV
jgi:hypothetical protein